MGAARVVWSCASALKAGRLDRCEVSSMEAEGRLSVSAAGDSHCSDERALYCVRGTAVSHRGRGEGEGAGNGRNGVTAWNGLWWSEIVSDGDAQTADYAPRDRAAAEAKLVLTKFATQAHHAGCRRNLPGSRAAHKLAGWLAAGC